MNRNGFCIMTQMYTKTGFAARVMYPGSVNYGLIYKGNSMAFSIQLTRI